MAGAELSHDAEAGKLLAGRYRVERRLARGGMGEVVAVLDQSTGRRVALKRLLAGNDARMTGMFEREYHTLVGLKHPRIIEAYEYGVSDGRPYYTMELLDGQDLRQLAPLPYRRACRYLRDVASSLALLHARRLLHRDVGPRNVRITSDDRGKLIDFGAMASFGVVDLVVGTPPFVAPEAVQRTPLDQRSDLYSLGALGYWLLTGTHAFPARSIHELPELWRKSPPPPSELVAALQAQDQWLEAVPPALDELVMGLLTRNPLGRPGSAIEVIERLNAIADLEPEQEELSARSYLHGGATVGREREQQRLRKRLAATLRGQGASVVIEAVHGMGSSRLISELALDAQLAGATPLVIDAKLHRGVYGVAHAVIEKLVVALPDEVVAAAVQHAEVLSRFSPLLASRMPAGSTTVGQWPAGELRRRTQNALSDWLFALCRKRPLVLAIDNAQRMDEGSAALLATLARAARERALYVIVARKPGEPASSPAAMRAIDEAGATIRLRGLARDDVHALVRSLFGDVQNTGRLAEWLHRLSGGNPQSCMDLVHHLVDQRVIRYAEGMWTLPQELARHELPASLEQAQDARIGRLGEPARRLASALCVHRGTLPIERCLAVAAAAGVGDPHAALDELTREGLLIVSGDGCHFGHDTVRERIYNQLDASVRRQLHGQMGRFLSAGRKLDINAMLDAGWHLVNGDREGRGAELLAEAGMQLAHGNDEMGAAVPALHAALQVFRKEGRPRHELVRLVAPLAVAGYRVDRRLAVEYGDEALQLLGDCLGLRLARRLRPLLGRRLGLYVGLAFGFFRYLLPGRGGVGAFRDTLTMLFTCAISLTGAATICFDTERARRYAMSLEPMAVLGRDHVAGIGFEFASILSRLPEDQTAATVAGCERVLARLDSDKPIRALRSDARVMIAGGLYYALGAMSCFRDGPLALHWAEKLDALALKLYAMAADQIRTVYHALRGEIATANRFRERVELHAIQAGSGWQVEVWQPAGLNLVSLLTADVIGQKNVAEQLDRLVADVPTLARHAQIARASYYMLKGNPLLAYEIRRGVLDQTPDRGYVGWPATMAAQAHTLLALGRAQEAKEVCERVLRTMTAADAPYIAMYQHTHTALALAEAELGDPEGARARLDALILEHGPAEGPLTLGNFHGAAARIALKQGDSRAAEHHRKQMDRWFRPTGNPVLIAQCERIRRAVVKLMQDKGELPRGEQLATGAVALEVQTARSALSECAGPSERASRALEIVLGHTRSSGGYLFTYDAKADRLQLVAPDHGDDPPAHLVEVLLRAIRAASVGDDVPTEVVSSSGTDTTAHSRIEVGTQIYRNFLLSTGEPDAPIVGAVAIVESDEPIGTPDLELLQTLARSLHEAGDEQRVSGAMGPAIPVLRGTAPRKA